MIEKKEEEELLVISTNNPKVYVVIDFWVRKIQFNQNFVP
jgi:hypothetical protein